MNLIKGIRIVLGLFPRNRRVGNSEPNRGRIGADANFFYRTFYGDGCLSILPSDTSRSFPGTIVSLQQNYFYHRSNFSWQARRNRLGPGQRTFHWVGLILSLAVAWLSSALFTSGPIARIETYLRPIINAW